MLDALNAEQIMAVKEVKGPVIVFAGAGSGKTRTLTYRIAYMIKELNIPPFTILAITFTNKATNEMKERLYKLIGEDANGLTVSTFHSLFARILRHEIHHIGYSRNYMIVDEGDQASIIGEVIQNLRLDSREFNGKRMQKVISSHKSHNTKPQSYDERMIYDEYENYLKTNNLLDFEDLLLKTYELFSQHPQVLSKYQQRFTYILVDEFQDTNTTQYNILKLLVQKTKNIFVVGDDDQSIYAFRGADYTNIQKFRQDFPDHKEYHLTQNYRSTQVILDGCNALIKNNQEREDIELWSTTPGSADDCVIRELYDHHEEADFVVKEIAKLYKQGKRYKDFAIIYRSTPLSRNFEVRLKQERIPYRIFGGISYLRRKEIKDIVAYLSLIINHNDIFSFKRIINVPRRGIGLRTVSRIEEIYEQERDLLKAIEIAKDGISKSRLNIILEFKEMILDLARKINELPLGDFFDQVLEQTGYLQMLIEEGDQDDRIDNLMEFKSILYQIDKDNQYETLRDKLQAAIDQALLSEEQNDLDAQEEDYVTLTTVHSAKGLEFRYVFMTGLEEGVFPSKTSIFENNLEEERRVAYVGMTRAQEKLYLTSAQNRLLYGNYNRNRPSRFINEFQEGIKKHIVQKPIEQPTLPKKPKTTKKETTIKNASDYKVGDKVIHTTYGEGTIVGINDKMGFIVFTKEGKIGKFDLTHHAISKVE